MFTSVSPANCPEINCSENLTYMDGCCKKCNVTAVNDSQIKDFRKFDF